MSSRKDYRPNVLTGIHPEGKSNQVKNRDDKDRLVIAGTGHRPQKLNPFDQNDRKFGFSQEAHQLLLETARQTLSEFQELHPDKEIEVISGVALGFDQALIEAALEKEMHVVAAVPFEGQEKAWRMDTQRQYHELLDRVRAAGGEIHVVSPGGYSAAKMQARNVWMVDRADQIVALYSGGPGGTSNCIDYAKEQGKEVRNVWQTFAERVRQLKEGREKGVQQPQQQHQQSRLHAQIDVVHVNTYRGERGDNFIYIGRAMPAHGLDASPLANPYRIGPDGTREEVIEKSYNWLRGEFKDLNSPARQELLRIKAMVETGQKVTLACWCAPQRCHGEIIRDSVVKLIERDRSHGARDTRSEQVREAQETRTAVSSNETRSGDGRRQEPLQPNQGGGEAQREIQTERAESIRAHQAHLDILSQERVYFVEEVHALTDSSGGTLTKQDGELRTETDYRLIPDGFSRDDYHSLYNPADGRTRAEHAGYLNGLDQEARDAFERGATLYGDVLVIPKEFDSLPREANITTRQHAAKVIGEFIKDEALAQEKADELVTIADQICGRWMNSLPSGTKARITIFQNIYEQFTHDSAGGPIPVEERAEALDRALESSRVLAAEMMALEPRQEDEEHILDETLIDHELAQSDAEHFRDENELYAHLYEEAVEMGQLSAESHDHVEVEDRTGPAMPETSYERISLSDLPPAIPEGISLDEQDRLLSETIPSVDKDLEQGMSRDEIMRGIYAEYAREARDLLDDRVTAQFAAAQDKNDLSRGATRSELLQAYTTLQVLVSEELDKELSRFDASTLRELRQFYAASSRAHSEHSEVRSLGRGDASPQTNPLATAFYVANERDIRVSQQKLLQMENIPTKGAVERIENLEQTLMVLSGAIDRLEPSRQERIAALNEVDRRTSSLIATEQERLSSYEAARSGRTEQTDRGTQQSLAEHSIGEHNLGCVEIRDRKGNLISPQLAGAERAAQIVAAERAGLGAGQAAHESEKVGPVFISVDGRSNVRLPVGSLQEHRAVMTMADACKLQVTSWHGLHGKEITGRNENHEHAARFVKSYIDFRRKDYETRLMNESVEYRVYMERLNAVQTIEELRSVSKDIRRDNYSRSQQIRAHNQDPMSHALPPRIDPTNNAPPRALTSEQMRQLFISSPPSHYTDEMKDYRRGLSVMGREKAERVEALSRGEIKPSKELTSLIGELERRGTPEALNHYTRCLIKPANEMVRPSSFDMHAVYEKLLPYERDYIYKALSEKRAAILPQHSRQQVQSNAPGRAADERAQERQVIKELSTTAAFKNYYAASTWKEAHLFALEQARRSQNAAQSERRATVIQGISDRNLTAIGYVIHNSDARQARDVAAYLTSSQNRQMRAAGEVLQAFSEIKRDAREDGRIELSLTIPQNSRFGEGDWRTLFNHFHPDDRSEHRFSRESLPEGRQSDIRRDAQVMAWAEMEPQVRATSYSPDSRAEVLYKALDVRETLQTTRSLQESARTAHYTLEGHVQACVSEVERRRGAGGGQDEVERGINDRERTESLVKAALDPDYARANSELLNEQAEEYRFVQQVLTSAHVKTYQQMKTYAAKAKQKYLSSFLALDRKQQELSTAREFDAQQRPAASPVLEEQARQSDARATFQRSFEESERQLTGERLEKMYEAGQLNDRDQVPPDQPIRNLLPAEDRNQISAEAREAAWWSLVPEEARVANYDERMSVEVLDRALDVSDAVSNARDVDRNLNSARAELTEFLSAHATTVAQQRDSGEIPARELTASDSAERDLALASELLRSLGDEDRDRLEGIMDRVAAGGEELGRAFEEIDRAQTGLDLTREEQLMEHRAALFSEVRRPMEERMTAYLNEAYRQDGIDAFRDPALSEQHVQSLSETMRDCVEDYNITIEDLNLRDEDLRDIARDLVSSVSATLEHNQEHTINRDILTSGHDYVNGQKSDIRALDMSLTRGGAGQDRALGDMTLQEMSEQSKTEAKFDFSREDVSAPRAVDKEQTEGVRGMESPVAEHDRVSDHLEHMRGDDLQIFTH